MIPNGVDLDPERAARGAGRPQGERLRILFVGQAVERKGLPLLLRAFEALGEHIPAELTVIGPSRAELAPLMLDVGGVRVLGKVDDETKWRELEEADVLCAPRRSGRELRDGPDRGVRRRHPGGGLQHRRLPRRCQRWR